MARLRMSVGLSRSCEQLLFWKMTQAPTYKDTAGGSVSGPGPKAENEMHRLSPDLLRLIEGCETVEGLSPQDRSRAREALQFLAGEGFVPVVNGQLQLTHPICMQFVNQVAWTRRWLAWLADALRACKNSVGAETLLARLKDPARCREALSVLRAADRLRRTGLIVGFDEIPDDGRGKRPDMAIRDAITGEVFHVEISSLGESYASREAGATSWAIVAVLMQPGPMLGYCGRIHKSLSEPHRLEIARQVAIVVQRAVGEGTFQAVEIPGILELAVAPPGAESALSVWASDREIQPRTLAGPPFRSDEINRVRIAIRKKQHQLPRDRANLLIVENAALFHSQSAAYAAIPEIEEEAFTYPHLAGVVVSGSHGGCSEPISHMLAPHAYFCHSNHNYLIEHHLVLLNRFCRVPVPTALLARMYSAFAQPLD